MFLINTGAFTLWWIGDGAHQFAMGRSPLPFLEAEDLPAQPDSMPLEASALLSAVPTGYSQGTILRLAGKLTYKFQSAVVS